MERFDLFPCDLSKSVVALVSICDLLDFERPQNLRPMNMVTFVNLANDVAIKLGIPERASNNLELLGKVVQAIIDASIIQGRTSLNQVEQVYNKKILELS